jgi:5-methylcytosine-specific restriction endonuclease McrA
MTGRRPGRGGAAWVALVRQVRREEDTCWLCRRPIDPDAAPKTRWAFSVDHVVPLSRGGHPLHRDNARAAHYGCNSARGNRVPAVVQVPVSSRVW